MKGTKRWLRAVSLSLALASFVVLSSGCGGTFDGTNGEKTVDAMLEVMSQVQSVETSITLDIQGRFSSGTSVGSEAHTAAVNSTSTIESTLSPLSVHSQHYSSILVDGAISREEREYYIVPDGSDFVRYDYIASTGDWTQSNVQRPDALTIPRKTGLIHDWKDFMSGLHYSEKVTSDNKEQEYVVYTGEVNKAVFEELLGDNMFGSFTTSMEWLLKENVPCTFYIDAETALPDRFTLDFSDSFQTSDMTFTLAELTVNYGEWNSIKSVEAPKRVTVVSSNPDAEFYSTYYAWNLFLPYIGGKIDGTGTTGNSGQSFASSWSSFQVRIDGGMTEIPLSYEDLNKVGYTVEEKNASLIVEPNKYKEDVVLCKGSDKLTVWLYNDDTVAQPVTKCKICCIDYIASQLPTNGIKIYFPGEVTLGITKDALLSAYGEPSDEQSAFSCDTYTWNGDSESQSLLAEISPVTGQVIRLRVCNIPVTGGGQK